MGRNVVVAGLPHAPVLLTTALVAAACTPSAPAAPTPSSNECVVVADTARPHITFGVVSGSGRRHVGEYSSMDVLAGHLYETLVRVDCADRVIAGLADSWSSSDGGYWRFEIRRGASFTDGTPATAPAMAAALSLAPVSGGVTAMSEYDLRVMSGRADVRMFARRDLMVHRMQGAGSPSGTDRYTPAFQADGRTVQLIARSAPGGLGSTPVARSDAPDTISILTFGADLRAAIDAGVDALVTNDAATIAYARARSGYRVAPLTWSSTYVLASAGGGDSVASVPALAFTDAVVGAASRSAMPPFWWDSCRTFVDTGDSPADIPRRRDGAAAPGDGRILFLRDDPIARAIAERITALARGRAPEWLEQRISFDLSPRAEGVNQEELRAALNDRSVAAVVTALRRVEHGGCGPSSMQFYAPLLDGWRVTPLIDTRDDLVYRAGIGRVTVDADGTLRFGGR
ncbi:MAG: hypothetical protein KFH98_10160 [Gemmatimonadetes bacterium]|nr:hypothetical protein [Gemmatimonadota bacterium]